MNQTDNRKVTLEFNKLQKRLRRSVANAINDYGMIEEDDVVMVAMSGGKDSFVMLDMLLSLQKVAPVKFDVIAVNLDQKQPGFPQQVLPDYFKVHNIPYYIVDKNTFAVVREKIPEGKTTCGLCSRLRRGTLYAFAEKIAATKIALGHHMDDIVETLFLNIFYGAKMKAMPPKLRSDDERNIVIRPLAYCRERDLQHYAEHKAFPIIPCNLCGSQQDLKRQVIKGMLAQWDKISPGRVENVFKSIQNINPSQLADKNLFNFGELSVSRSGQRAKYAFTEATVSSTNIDMPGSITVTNL